jgi:hypothetical protein
MNARVVAIARMINGLINYRRKGPASVVHEQRTEYGDPFADDGSVPDA